MQLKTFLTLLQLLNFVCIIAITNVFMEQQILYGLLLQPLQLTSHYYSY